MSKHEGPPQEVRANAQQFIEHYTEQGYLYASYKKSTNNMYFSKKTNEGFNWAAIEKDFVLEDLIKVLESEGRILTVEMDRLT